MSEFPSPVSEKAEGLRRCFEDHICSDPQDVGL